AFIARKARVQSDQRIDPHHFVKLLEPKGARLIAAGSRGHKKKARNVLALQHWQHVRKSVNQTVITREQDCAWRKRLAILDGGPEILRVNDLVMSLQKLELLSKNIWMYEASIEENVTAGVARRKHAMVIHDSVARLWCDTVEPSAVM